MKRQLGEDALRYSLPDEFWGLLLFIERPIPTQAFRPFDSDCKRRVIRCLVNDDLPVPGPVPDALADCLTHRVMQLRSQNDPEAPPKAGSEVPLFVGTPTGIRYRNGQGYGDIAFDLFS